MSCPFDLREYVCGELPAAQTGAVQEHLRACTSCREELAQLELTRTMLLAVPQEEPPRRIAFVSDAVLQPRWWQRLWHSGPQLGFASAALLAGAILVHGYNRPAAVIAPGSGANAAVVQAEVDRRVATEVQQRLEPAVQQAVAAAEARQRAQFVQILDQRLKNSETHIALARQQDLKKHAEWEDYWSKSITTLAAGFYSRADTGAKGGE